MRIGTVKQFDSAAGFGFIDDDLIEASYFVLYTAIKKAGHKSLEIEQRARCQLAQDKKGLQRINVYTDNDEGGY